MAKPSMTQEATYRNKSRAITVFLNGIAKEHSQRWKRTKESGNRITGGLLECGGTATTSSD